MLDHEGNAGIWGNNAVFVRPRIAAADEWDCALGLQENHVVHC